MGENSLCSLFPHLYHLSSSKNCMVSNLLVGSENLAPFSFGFCCNLINRETTEVASLLFLVEGCSFREGRRDVCVWSPNLSQGYTCNFLFCCWIPPLLWSVFDVV